MAPNTWPSQPAGFRESMETFYASMENLASDVAKAFGVALEMERHTSILSCNHYPRMDCIRAQPHQLRIAAHTDVSLFTIVASRPRHDTPLGQQGGLEVRRWSNAGGGRDSGDECEWFRVAPCPRRMILNIGDCLEFMSAGRWCATTHRVSNPQPALPVKACLRTRDHVDNPVVDARTRMGLATSSLRATITFS